MDPDKHGYVVALELRELLTTLDPNITKEESDLLVKEADCRGDGKITFDNFIRIMLNHRHNDLQPSNIKKDLLESFKVLDPDNNGFVVTSELRELLPSINEKLTTAEIDRMIQEYDTQGRGKIYRSSFVRMMTAKKM